MKKRLTVWRVTAGSFSRDYFTEHHAEQMARALSLHGMAPTITPHRLPDDALTRIAVQP